MPKKTTIEKKPKSSEARLASLRNRLSDSQERASGLRAENERLIKQCMGLERALLEKNEELQEVNDELKAAKEIWKMEVDLLKEKDALLEDELQRACDLNRQLVMSLAVATGTKL